MSLNDREQEHNPSPTKECIRMTHPSIFVGNGMGGAHVILGGRGGTRNYA